MRRDRVLLAIVLWLCSALAVGAQNSRDLPLVGVMRLSTPQNVEPIPTIFRNALAALGHVDGACGHEPPYRELQRRTAVEWPNKPKMEDAEDD